MIALTKRSDVRQLETAVRHQWDIPDKTFADLPARLLEIVAARDEDGSYQYGHRLRLSAIRCLIVMQGQNLAANPAPQELHVSQSFAFDMATAATMSRDEMATVTRALGLTNGRHNGNGEQPTADD